MNNIRKIGIQNAKYCEVLVKVPKNYYLNFFTKNSETY